MEGSSELRLYMIFRKHACVSGNRDWSRIFNPCRSLGTLCVCAVCGICWCHMNFHMPHKLCSCPYRWSFWIHKMGCEIPDCLVCRPPPVVLTPDSSSAWAHSHLRHPLCLWDMCITWALQNLFICASLARRTNVLFQVGYFLSSMKLRTFWKQNTWTGIKQKNWEKQIATIYHTLSSRFRELFLTAKP